MNKEVATLHLISIFKEIKGYTFQVSFFDKVSFSSYQMTLIDPNDNLVISIIGETKDPERCRIVNTHPVLQKMKFPKFFSIDLLAEELPRIIDFYEKYDTILEETIETLNKKISLPKGFSFTTYKNLIGEDPNGFCLQLNLESMVKTELKVFYPIYSKDSLYVLAGKDLVYSIEDFERYIISSLKELALKYKTQLLPKKLDEIILILEFLLLSEPEDKSTIYQSTNTINFLSLNAIKKHLLLLKKVMGYV